MFEMKALGGAGSRGDAGAVLAAPASAVQRDTLPLGLSVCQP